MKKSLVMIMIMFLITGVLYGTVSAASASVNASPSSVEIGNNVTITVSFGGQKVSTAKFTLDYDTTKLEYVSYSCGGSGLKEFGTGTKRFGYVGTTEDLSSVSFTFKTKAVGSASVSAKNVQISAQGQTNASAGSPSTSITIKEKPQPTTTPTTNQTTNNNKKPTTTTTKKPTTNSNNKKDENPVEEPVVEEPIVEEPVVKEPAPNVLIKINDEDVKTLKDELTQVMIKAQPVAVEDGTSLVVKRTKQGDDTYQSRNDMFNDIEGNKIYFDLSLVKENVAVQPNGYVTVFLPIPDDYNKELLQAYKINEDGTYRLLQGEIQGNYYTFTTNSPANYCLVEKPEKKTWQQEMAEKITDVLGNVKILQITIVILLCIILVDTIIIIKLSRKRAKRSK